MLNKKYFYIFLLVLVTFVYFIYTPQNFSESEDAYWYAYDIEHASYIELIHPHHLSYLIFAKVLYKLIPFLSGFNILLILSKLFAIGTAVVVYLFIRNESNNLKAAALSTLFLLSFYGFWRYANIPEFYTPASFISIFIVYLTYKLKTNFKAIIIAALSVVAASFHILTVALTFWALPIYMLFTKQHKLLLNYILLATPLTFITYIIFFNLAKPEMLGNVLQWIMLSGSESSNILSISSINKALIGYGQSILSPNFLFAFDTFRDYMALKFPGNMLEEEFFLGKNITATASYVCLILTILLLLAIMILTLKIVKYWKKKNLKGINFIIIGVSWLIGHAAITLNSASSNPELWISASVPTALILAFFLTNYYEEAKGTFLIIFFIMLLHTTINASFLSSRTSDYYFQKYSLIEPHLDDGDIVLTLDNQILTRYLRYNLKQEVSIINFYGKEADKSEQVWKTVYGSEKDVYAFEDIFRIPYYYARKQKHLSDTLKMINQPHFEDFELSGSNETGNLYKFNRSFASIDATLVPSSP